MIAASMHWLALVLGLAALVASVAALMARSLFAMCMCIAAAGALATGVLLALRAGDAGLVVALFSAAWAPILLLGTILLSVRSVKPMRGAPWFSLAAAGAAGTAIMWVVPDLTPAAAQASGGEGAVGPWLAPLLLVAAAACVGLLGYGERGALQRQENPPP
jgi:hypothetical protein